MRIGAVIGAAALSTFAFAPAFATHDATSEADASASTGTGPLFELLDTGACTAVDTATTAEGTPTGRCGDGLSLNEQINAFSQNASAPGDGTSAADASVAPIDIADFTAIDLTGVVDGLEAIDTGTVLDDVVGGATEALQPLLEPLTAQAIAPIDDALQDALAQVEANLPLSIQIGAVESQCNATANPLSAEGNGIIAGINLVVQLGDQQIVVPIHAESAPNSNLLVGSPQDVVDAIIDGLEASFTQSLGGALAPLNQILSTFQEQVTNAIFAQLEPTLLQGLADALEPLIAGTVNKQVPVSPSSTGEIEVTGLELILGGGEIGTLELARTHCGPNTDGTPHDGEPTPTPTDPGPGPGDNGGGDIPTVVDSGVGGGNQGMFILAGTALLMLTAGATGLLGYRRMLQR